jgi:hypothetical protein
MAAGMADARNFRAQILMDAHGNRGPVRCAFRAFDPDSMRNALPGSDIINRNPLTDAEAQKRWLRDLNPDQWFTNYKSSWVTNQRRSPLTNSRT